MKNTGKTDQFQTAKYLQSRIDLYTEAIRANKRDCIHFMQTVQPDLFARAIQRYYGNQVGLKEVLTIALELLDVEIFNEYIHCDLDVQAQLTLEDLQCLSKAS